MKLPTKWELVLGTKGIRRTLELSLYCLVRQNTYDHVMGSYAMPSVFKMY